MLKGGCIVPLGGDSYVHVIPSPRNDSKTKKGTQNLVIKVLEKVHGKWKRKQFEMVWTRREKK